MGQVELVANNNHGERILVLDAQDLLLERPDFLEALARGNGVDKQEALASAHVLFPHRRVFFLAGRVQHVKERYFIVDNALLAIRICEDAVSRRSDAQEKKGQDSMLTLDGRVILVDEVRLNQLDGKARLADTTTADNHQLVLSRELYRGNSSAEQFTMERRARRMRDRVGWVNHLKSKQTNPPWRPLLLFVLLLGIKEGVSWNGAGRCFVSFRRWWTLDEM